MPKKKKNEDVDMRRRVTCNLDKENKKQINTIFDALPDLNPSLPSLKYCCDSSLLQTRPTHRTLKVSSLLNEQSNLRQKVSVAKGQREKN